MISFQERMLSKMKKNCPKSLPKFDLVNSLNHLRLDFSRKKGRRGKGEGVLKGFISINDQNKSFWGLQYVWSWDNICTRGLYWVHFSHTSKSYCMQKKWQRNWNNIKARAIAGRYTNICMINEWEIFLMIFRRFSEEMWIAFKKTINPIFPVYINIFKFSNNISGNKNRNLI